MIACPLCGLETNVTETRTPMHGDYVRRRRRRLAIGCAGRVTTVEFPVPQGIRVIDDPVIVPRTLLEQVRGLMDGALAKPQSPDDDHEHDW